ncbi:MAG: hypothetical protein MUF54_00215 [Polyangiaceae bacterium]|jgi:tetratricopeptide (TPR) repeat protein|nr:hypothetical protein [Polyangiaceae bacterium]
MAHLVCESCGSALRLSLPEDAYVCDAAPQEHRHARADCERRWLEAALVRSRAAPHDSPARVAILELKIDLAAQAFRAGDEDGGRRALADAVLESDALIAGDAVAPVRDETVALLSEIADSAERLDDRAIALAAYERMVVLCRAACVQATAERQQLRALSASLNGAGRMTRYLGDYVRATRFFEEDLALLRRLHQAHPRDAEVRCDLAVAHFNLYLVATSRDHELTHLRAVEALLSEQLEGELPARATEVLGRAKQQIELLEALRDARGAAGPSNPDLTETQDAPKYVGLGATAHSTQRSWLVREVQRELARRYPSGDAKRPQS